MTVLVVDHSLTLPALFVPFRFVRCGSDAIDGDDGDAENDPVDVGVVGVVNVDDATRDDDEYRSCHSWAAAAVATTKTRKGVVRAVRRGVGTRGDGWR